MRSVESSREMKRSLARGPYTVPSPNSSTVVTIETRQESCPINIKAHLRRCLDRMNFYTSGGNLFFVNEDVTSSFAEKLETVSSFVYNTIQSEGLHGIDHTKKAALYVCGVPGVGKTSGVLHTCKNILKTFMERKTEDDVIHPVLCYINAGHLATAPNPYKYLEKKIHQALHNSRGRLEKCLQKDDNMVIVVVDEIENLLSIHHSERPPATESERALKQLIEWATRDTYHLALIGISNSAGDSKFGRMQLMHEFDILTFSAYNAADLSCILQGHIGPNVMEPSAIEYVAKTVAGSGGDARKALEMASKAITNCLDELTENSLASTPHNLVKLKHVLALTTTQSKHYNEIIQGLPEDGKAVLCVLCVLSKTDFTRTTLRALRRFVAECMDEAANGFELSSFADFRLIMETLENSSLIRLGSNTGKNYKLPDNPTLTELLNTPICIGTQASDIEKAIQAELGKNRFYAGLMAQTEKNLNRFRDKSSGFNYH